MIYEITKRMIKKISSFTIKKRVNNDNIPIVGYSEFIYYKFVSTNSKTGYILMANHENVLYYIHSEIMLARFLKPYLLPDFIQNCLLAQEMVKLNNL